MKFKKMFYCAIAFCLFALSSCGPDNVDYADKVEGNYSVTITQGINLKFDGYQMTTPNEKIETTASITKDDEDGNVTIRIKGVNGFINDMEMKAFCSGLGMNIDDCDYDGIVNAGELGMLDCDFVLKNPTTTISNSKIFNWNSTVTGQCELNYVGLEITCAASGSMNFNLTYKNEK